jgi:hypothetical protein
MRDRPGNRGDQRPILRRVLQLGQRLHALAAQRGLVIVQRMPRQIEADRCMFLRQLFGRQPDGGHHGARRRQILAPAKQR